MRSLLLLGFALLACKDGDRDDAPIGCIELCRSMESCGLLPSWLADGDEPRSDCETRCARTDDDAVAVLEACAESIARSPSRPTVGCERSHSGRAGWCTPAASCVAVASCVTEHLGDPAAIGEIDVGVALVASPDARGECLVGDPESATPGPCPPDRQCESDAIAVAPMPERALSSGGDGSIGCVQSTPLATWTATTSPSVRPSYCAVSGLTDVTVWLEGWRSSTDPRVASCTELGAPSLQFPAQSPGPVQAVAELRGEYPLASEPDASLDSFALAVPAGGLTGPYCWVFRGEVEILRAATPNAWSLLPVPPTAAHAVARAWAQADREARGLPPILYTCESSAAQCRDEYDDDGDAMPDCGDLDCASWCEVEESDVETCGDLRDNDDDGTIDCDDPGCAAMCESSPPRCRNRVDDDGDGAIDCADPSCAAVCGAHLAGCGVEGCPALRTVVQQNPCADLDPVDGRPDCRARNCAWECAVEPPVACGNGADDDGDGLSDCADPDCSGPACEENTAYTCADGRDDDGDQRIDCADYDCRAFCAEVTFELCHDGRDNDCAGVVGACDGRGADCGDVACRLFCFEGGLAACTDGVDNDQDYDVDCDDEDCADVCDETTRVHCRDGRDNDRDHAADAADPGCAQHLR